MKQGLYSNIAAKRERIKAGSGEKMRGTPKYIWVGTGTVGSNLARFCKHVFILDIPTII